MNRCAAWLLLIPLMAGCRCRPGPVEPIELGLRVQPAQVEFGRVLEGVTKVETVSLTSVTRAAITVELDTAPPFAVPATVEVPGGGELLVPVSFLAGNTEVERVLRLTVGDRTAELRLHGVGVRPPDCRPSAACIVSVYSLEEDRCIESQSPDDAPCDTASVCLEQGRCRSGQCLGIARRCDDNDLCTDDACAMDLGCIHTPHACPSPGGACRVATCDGRLGCGEGPAADATPCGPQSCVEVNFCFMGACRTQPTPEGLPCSPAIACLPEAQCRSQVCQRPTVGDWVPAWSARLPGEPTGGLASSGSTLFFSICVDAGLPMSDAGVDDAGVGDAGVEDAGTEDGGINDGGPIDPQTDAGAPAVRLACSLVSYTGTGFERFERDGGAQPNDYVDGAPRSIVAVNASGVLLQRDGGLELRSPVTGALRYELELEVSRSLLVLERERVLFWADGGVQAWIDGGVTFLASVEKPTALGRGNALFAWNPDAGLLTRLTFPLDGGVERQDLVTSGVSSASLAVVSNDVALGAEGRVRFDGVDDGGLLPFDWTGAAATQYFDELSLSSALATDVFYLRGPETYVRVFDTMGAQLWETAVVSPAFPGTMVATTLVDGRLGGFVTVLRTETDAGPRALMALFADGERKAVCNLPEASGAVEQAHFSASSLVITARRPDGGVVLESYELGALPVSRSGWATPQGVSGTRSDRP